MIAKPLTGRTHQIRVALKSQGAPVLGDPLYGDAACNKRESRRAPRPMLHAYQLRFAHPTDGGDGSVAAPPRTVLRASASDVTIDKDFRLALGTCGVALVLDQIPIIKWLPGLPLTLLGILFLIQT